MSSLNKVMLIGNLTRDPELRHTNNGNAVCEFGIAVNRKFGEKEEVTFINLIAWKNTAEAINRFCQKGDSLFIEGRLQLDSWDDKDTGAKRSRLIVVADSVQFLTKRESSQQGQSQGQYQQPKQFNQPWGGGGYQDDDMPF